MALAAGTKFGPYEITGAIGAGGMGEVYEARDTKLGRNVAIKVLPTAFANDPERLARFQREAKMLAALNHPNIATIHGLEQSDGTQFLVMELVPGETLADRVKAGAVPLEEALKIAVQIAEALEAAHEKNIIHRDLKPANVKVTPEGKVKVLDFGLAKAFEGNSASNEMNNSPTLSHAATMQGVILGTAAYMSPEQARGKSVDKRTDIWAFGCALYEMLSGRQAFHGEDVTDILAAVVKTEPDWSKLPAEMPASVSILLRRCLRKDRRQRLADASGVRIEIEDALATPQVANLATPAPIKRGRRDRLPWVVAVTALAGMLALSIPAIVHLREVPPAVAPEMRTEIVTPPTSDPVSFALSPDGQQIVFVASGDGPSRLWLRRLDTIATKPLAGTEGATYPFWSPDSRSVGFFAGGNLKRVDIGGGSPQTLTASLGRGGTWSPDAIILFASTAASPLSRISASGGESVAVTKLDKQSSHRFPQFLPDGRQFLFYAQATPEPSGVYLGSLDSPKTKFLGASETAGAYAPNGWVLFIRAGTLLAQRLDLGRKELIGDPVTLADEVSYNANIFAGAFSVSASGLVAYRSGSFSQHQLVWFDRTGKMLGAVGVPDSSLSSPHLSPDGRRVAAYRTVQGNTDIWLLDGTRSTRFTFDSSRHLFPLWSPDGKYIVFDSNRKGHRDLYIKASNGAGSEELLLESAQDKTAYDWSRDGRYLLYSSLDPQTSRDIWVLPMQGDRRPFVFVNTRFDERAAQFSPDGHWVAYISNESGRFEVYVRPFGRTSSEVAGGQWQVSTSGGLAPRWRSDGKELYYIAPDDKLMVAQVRTSGATFEPGTPVALFQTQIYGGGNDPGTGIQYDVSGDGRFLIDTVKEDASSSIMLLQNWTASLKK